jgi:hypothetical protein
VVEGWAEWRLGILIVDLLVLPGRPTGGEWFCIRRSGCTPVVVSIPELRYLVSV